MSQQTLKIARSSNSLRRESFKDETKLHQFITEAYNAPWLIADWETDASDPRTALAGLTKLVTMGLAMTYRGSDGKLRSEYVSFNHLDFKNSPEIIQATKTLIRTHRRVAAYNIKFDDLICQLNDCVPQGLLYCGLMMAHFLDQSYLDYGLDAISKLYGGRPKKMSDNMRATIDNPDLGWRWVKFLDMYDYATNDSEITYELIVDKLFPEFSKRGFDGELWEREVKKIRVLNKMEIIGVKADPDFCKTEIKKAHQKMGEIRTSLQGRNPSSGKDLYQMLIVELGLPVVKRSPKTKKPSFDKVAMKKYDALLARTQSPIAKNIIEYRGWQTVSSLIYQACLDNIGSDGRVRTHYIPWGTNTSRLSSREPNEQQLPKVTDKEWNGNARNAYVPENDDYELVDFDYDQLELRLTVSYSGEEKLIKVFQEDRDLFDEMSETLGLPRDPIKTFVYSTSYGAGDEKVAGALGIPISDASKIRKDFISAYPKIHKFSREVVNAFIRYGYIELWTGRRVNKPKFYKPEKDKDYAAFNYLIQGGGAEIVTTQMIRLAEIIDWDTCKMVAQVHDSLTFEIRKDKKDYWIPIIKNTMQDVSFTGTTIPFTVSHKKWGT